MSERRGFVRRPVRSLESDVLTLHVVLGAALSGRTTPAHAWRAARRAHESARAILWPDSCPSCGEPIAARWIVWQGRALPAAPADRAGWARSYCSRGCAEAAIAAADLVRETTPPAGIPRLEVTR